MSLRHAKWYARRNTSGLKLQMWGKLSLTQVEWHQDRTHPLFSCDKSSELRLGHIGWYGRQNTSSPQWQVYAKLSLGHVELDVRQNTTILALQVLKILSLRYLKW